MAAVNLDSRTIERLNLLALAWEVTPAEAISRLIDRFAATQSGISEEDGSSHVGIHAVYKGVRVEAKFDRATNSVEIVDGPLAGRRFKSPSGAAVAVVAAIDPEVNANRNGWGFWTITSNGQRLASIR